MGQVPGLVQVSIVPEMVGAGKLNVPMYQGSSDEPKTISEGVTEGS